MTPELDAMCAAIWEAVPGRCAWAELLERADGSLALNARNDTIRQATAALALAAEREKRLREALERCAKGDGEAQDVVAEHFLGVLQTAGVRPCDAIGCFATAVGFAIGLSNNEWTDEGAAAISEMIKASYDLACAARGAMGEG